MQKEKEKEMRKRKMKDKGVVKIVEWRQCKNIEKPNHMLIRGKTLSIPSSSIPKIFSKS